MKKPGEWTEGEVIEEVLTVLKSMYPGETFETINRGPDILVSLGGKDAFCVDCKKSQPLTRAGNGIPDRALGQMIRYQKKYSLPIFLVVPDDWTLHRVKGETHKPWKTQVEQLLRSANLETSIAVCTVSEVKAPGFKFLPTRCSSHL